jgi:hypothetical protein
MLPANADAEKIIQKKQINTNLFIKTPLKLIKKTSGQIFSEPGGGCLQLRKSSLLINLLIYGSVKEVLSLSEFKKIITHLYYP